MKPTILSFSDPEALIAGAATVTGRATAKGCAGAGAIVIINHVEPRTGETAQEIFAEAAGASSR